MTKAQEPDIPNATNLVEIDVAIYELQLAMDTNLDWLTHDYGRAYRHLEKDNRRIYFPEIYTGNGQYHRVTPDNDKKGMCYFVVGKETDDDFTEFHNNFIKWNLGIVFWLNLEKIDSVLIGTEIFTQNLIRDARSVLTKKLAGLSFRLTIKEVVREFSEIYREFNIQEDKGYLRAPYSAFRINCEIMMQETCGDYMFDSDKALIQAVSTDDLINVLLPTIDFSNPDAVDALSNEQKNDICGVPDVATVENSDLSYTQGVACGGILVLPDNNYEVFLDGLSQGVVTSPSLKDQIININWD